MATNFQKISKKYGINNCTEYNNYEAYLEDADGPCFMYHADTCDGMEGAEILQYLRACAREVRDQVVILSITERNLHHKAWVKAAEQVPKCTITPGRSIHAGHYKVWLIALTGMKK